MFSPLFVDYWIVKREPKHQKKKKKNVLLDKTGVNNDTQQALGKKLSV